MSNRLDIKTIQEGVDMPEKRGRAKSSDREARKLIYKGQAKQRKKPLDTKPWVKKKDRSVREF